MLNLLSLFCPAHCHMPHSSLHSVRYVFNILCCNVGFKLCCSKQCQHIFVVKNTILELIFLTYMLTSYYTLVSVTSASWSITWSLGSPSRGSVLLPLLLCSSPEQRRSSPDHHHCVSKQTLVPRYCTWVHSCERKRLNAEPCAVAVETPDFSSLFSHRCPNSSSSSKNYPEALEVWTVLHWQLLYRTRSKEVSLSENWTVILCFPSVQVKII